MPSYPRATSLAALREEAASADPEAALIDPEAALIAKLSLLKPENAPATVTPLRKMSPTKSDAGKRASPTGSPAAAGSPVGSPSMKPQPSPWSASGASIPALKAGEVMLELPAAFSRASATSPPMSPTGTLRSRAGSPAGSSHDLTALNNAVGGGAKLRFDAQGQIQLDERVSPESPHDPVSEEAFMRSACASAQAGVSLKHGGPFGASIISKEDGQILSCRHNTVLQDANPTRHAEMNAIRYACRFLGKKDLSHCVLYTTCEPCPMCWAATKNTNINLQYNGVDRKTAAEFGFDDSAFYEEILAVDESFRRASMGLPLVDEPEQAGELMCLECTAAPEAQQAGEAGEAGSGDLVLAMVQKAKEDEESAETAKDKPTVRTSGFLAIEAGEGPWPQSAPYTQLSLRETPLTFAANDEKVREEMMNLGKAAGERMLARHLAARSKNLADAGKVQDEDAKTEDGKTTDDGSESKWELVDQPTVETCVIYHFPTQEAIALSTAIDGTVVIDLSEATGGRVKELEDGSVVFALDGAKDVESVKSDKSDSSPGQALKNAVGFGCTDAKPTGDISKEKFNFGGHQIQITEVRDFLSCDATVDFVTWAVERACAKLGTYMLDGCGVYCSSRPHVMGLASLLWSRAEQLSIADMGQRAERCLTDLELVKTVAERRDTQFNVFAREQLQKQLEDDEERLLMAGRDSSAESSAESNEFEMRVEAGPWPDEGAKETAAAIAASVKAGSGSSTADSSTPTLDSLGPFLARGRDASSASLCSLGQGSYAGSLVADDVRLGPIRPETKVENHLSEECAQVFRNWQKANGVIY